MLIEGLLPLLKECVASLGLFHADDRIGNSINYLEVVTLGIVEEIPISHMKEQLGE